MALFYVELQAETKATFVQSVEVEANSEKEAKVLAIKQARAELISGEYYPFVDNAFDVDWDGITYEVIDVEED